MSPKIHSNRDNIDDDGEQDESVKEISSFDAFSIVCGLSLTLSPSFINAKKRWHITSSTNNFNLLKERRR
jgi:hypothetical protein